MRLAVLSAIVLWAGATAYLEIAIMLFSTMAAYAFWNWYQSKSDGWLLLSGTFCGFAEELRPLPERDREVGVQDSLPVAGHRFSVSSRLNHRKL